MIRFGRWIPLAAAVALAACSSNSTGAGADGGSAGGATVTSTGGTNSGGGASGTSASGGAVQAGGAGNGGKANSGGSAGQGSDVCVKYCDCMANNCADKIFPEGCLPACASQTNWDMTCRQGMCTLVPVEPNNDHCTHAFGVNECLAK